MRQAGESSETVDHERDPLLARVIGWEVSGDRGCEVAIAESVGERARDVVAYVRRSGLDLADELGSAVGRATTS